ncbi:MAG TPA: hypothetical protein VE604_00535 [Candidatus Polarisedimenticolia bacterium]|nr:hypothetical protein [Candidatus Polarisedimenticolia bacterium]
MLKVYMLKIAKTAAFVLAAMAPVLAVAQRSQGHLERKPSPATSAAPAAQSGTQTSPGSQQFVTSQNSFRPNPKSNAVPNTGLPASPQSIVRPMPPIPASPLAGQVAAPIAVATSAPVTNVQPVVNPTPSREATASVHYAQGQLTVSAQNASLGAVLKLISAKTGAVIDLAPELQNEPVIAQIGPSAVREVLTGLLDSPRIDYIIMGTGDAPGSLERIVVRTRQSFARTAMAGGRASQPRPQDGGTEAKLEENGRPTAGVAPAAEPLTQEQLMENWRKIREEKRLAEIEQQRQDRENEQTQVQVEPQPQPEPQPDNPPPAENPPQK